MRIKPGIMNDEEFETLQIYEEQFDNLDYEENRINEFVTGCEDEHLNNL